MLNLLFSTTSELRPEERCPPHLFPASELPDLSPSSLSSPRFCSHWKYALRRLRVLCCTGYSNILLFERLGPRRASMPGQRQAGRPWDAGMRTLPPPLPPNWVLSFSVHGSTVCFAHSLRVVQERVYIADRDFAVPCCFSVTQSERECTRSGTIMRAQCTLGSWNRSRRFALAVITTRDEVPCSHASVIVLLSRPRDTGCLARSLCLRATAAAASVCTTA